MLKEIRLPNLPIFTIQSKQKKGNDQKLIQSHPTSQTRNILLTGDITNITVSSSLNDDEKILSFADHNVELVTNTSSFEMKGGHDGTYVC